MKKFSIDLNWCMKNIEEYKRAIQWAEDINLPWTGIATGSTMNGVWYPGDIVFDNDDDATVFLLTFPGMVR